ncbi:MAG TPA: hypothetical protein VMF11_01455 [Candidatus Baltobacteraceae bacterium]|nr:hypothetical protein [Candidatus Baltobacteraceae bacterium]
MTLYATPPPDPSLYGGSTPLPTSTPWVSTTNQSVTQNVAVSTGQSFDGQSNLTEFTANETDAGQLQTTTTASQAYLSYVTDATRTNGIDVTEIGTSSSDSNGVATQTIFGTGNGVVEELPFVYGGQWTNTATRTDTETDPDDENITAAYNADGTYQEQFTYPEGGTASALTRDDGSGVYDVPIEGDAAGETSLSVEAPSGGQITVGLNIPVADEAAAFSVPDWYPVAPPDFASDTYVDEGSTTLPSSCKVGSSYQSASVEEFIETKTRLDTVFGEWENDQVTQYVSSSYGLLCEVVSDDLQDYYDYSTQSGSAFAFTFTTPPTPLVTTTVSETLALQSASYAATSSLAHRATAQDSSESTTSLALLPRPSLARANTLIAVAHARDVRVMNNAVRTDSVMRHTP